jgi:hypothetical protein
VGQANLIVIRHDDMHGRCSRIIDYGKVNPNLNNGVFLCSISDLIANTQVSLVVTHQNTDHYDFVDQIRTGQVRRQWIRQGVQFQHVLIGGPFKTSRTLSSIPNAQFCEVLDGGEIKDGHGTSVGQLRASTLQNQFCLGPEVGIQLLLPSAKVGNHEHDQNLVLKVTYNRESLLFPGDASGKLLDNIITKNTNILEYSFQSTGSDRKGICCMLQGVQVPP